MGKGCRVYATRVLEETEKDTPRLEGFHVLQEFKDVFPDKVLGLPPKRDVDPMIKLVPSKALVSNTPYRVSTPDLLELVMKLHDLWEKEYIRPSVFQWGAPVWFEKENDDTL